jgi:hypothetical protein
MSLTGPAAPVAYVAAAGVEVVAGILWLTGAIMEHHEK